MPKAGSLNAETTSLKSRFDYYNYCHSMNAYSIMTSSAPKKHVLNAYDFKIGNDIKNISISNLIGIHVMFFLYVENIWKPD